MVDPRERDPNFPDRPTHPDFILLSEVVQENDEAAEHTLDVFDIAEVDADSVFYLMKHRLFPRLDKKDHEMGGAAWLDGFVTGKKFAERKAKSEPRNERWD